MLIRFTFVNQFNPLEEDLLYIFNPLEMRGYTDGLLCGISSAGLMPCAFRCLVTLSPQPLGADEYAAGRQPQRQMKRAGAC